MTYQTIKVDSFEDGKIVKVTISRSKSLNALNPKLFQQIATIFTEINKMENVRVAILVAQGKAFTAGLDLKQYAGFFASFDWKEKEPAKVAIHIYGQLRAMQKQLLTLVECRVPVLVGIHGLCIGGGIDLISMADIRYCTSDAKFTIKQIDIGMAADIGTLQFMPTIIGNHSMFRQLAYTGRYFDSKEAYQMGFVNKICENKGQLDKQIMKTAKEIASKSPVGIYTIKQIMKREQYKKVYQSLEYMGRTNAVMLQTEDMKTAIMAWMSKSKPEFPKL